MWAQLAASSKWNSEAADLKKLMEEKMTSEEISKAKEIALKYDKKKLN